MLINVHTLTQKSPFLDVIDGGEDEKKLKLYSNHLFFSKVAMHIFMSVIITIDVHSHVLFAKSY